MDKHEIFIISGTLGSGKSTAAKIVAKKLKDCALIETDQFMDMLQNNEKPTWDNKLKFMWDDVIFVAKNALKLNLDVVIEGVIEDEFPLLENAFKDHKIHYHILTANQDTLTKRIVGRGTAELVQRSMDVLDKYKEDPQKAPYLLDTSNLKPEEVVEVILNSNPIN